MALGAILNPKVLGGLVGMIVLLVGVVTLSFGGLGIGLVEIGFAALIFSAAEVEIWKITVPAGVFLILVGAGVWVVSHTGTISHP